MYLSVVRIAVAVAALAGTTAAMGRQDMMMAAGMGVGPRRWFSMHHSVQELVQEFALQQSLPNLTTQYVSVSLD